VTRRLFLKGSTMAISSSPPNGTPVPNYYSAPTTVHDVGGWQGGEDLDQNGQAGDHRDVVLRDVRDLGAEGAREKYRQQAREKYLQPGSEDRSAYWRAVSDMDQEVEAAAAGKTDFGTEHAALTAQERGEADAGDTADTDVPETGSTPAKAATPTLSDKDVADMDAVWSSDQPDFDGDSNTDDADDAIKQLVDKFGPTKALAYANKKIDESTVYATEAERETQRGIVAEKIKTAGATPTTEPAGGVDSSEPYTPPEPGKSKGISSTLSRASAPASITPAPLTSEDTAALDQTWAKNYNINNDWAGDGDAETEMDKTAYSVFQHGAEKTLAHGYARISEDPQYTTVAERSAAAAKWKQQVTEAVPLADTYAAKNGLGSGADTAPEPGKS
jgi:hypothetical protein